ncbi:MAG: hypothetical protein HC817_15230 [Saprospiraceae bacterium]|nr:hypothetical protein [Saprospiraceae bacterium]
MPGTYSLYPNSHDERIVLNILANPNDINYPNALVYVADLTNLERHLLLFTQLRDLHFPVILCVNMLDAAAEQGIFFDEKALQEWAKVPVLGINGRTGDGIDLVKTKC